MVNIIFECSDIGITIPNGFSPNNDGVNDVFETPWLLEVEGGFILKIYNRYGVLVYEGGDSNSFWNGIANRGVNQTNKKSTVGTYYYVLALKKQSYYGWVYLSY